MIEFKIYKVGFYRFEIDHKITISIENEMIKNAFEKIGNIIIIRGNKCSIYIHGKDDYHFVMVN